MREVPRYFQYGRHARSPTETASEQDLQRGHEQSQVKCTYSDLGQHGPRPRPTSLGLTDYFLVDIPGLLYHSVNFGTEMHLSSPYRCARIDWDGARSIKYQIGETKSAFDVP